MSDVLLRVEDLGAGYGEGLVLEEISFALRRGGSLALLGRNGVGKSSLLLALMGHLAARTGRIAWRGNDITRSAPYARARMGMGWVPQERDVFASLTVDENLAIAVRPGPWTPKHVYEFFPSLDQRRRNLGRHLSGGEQQMLSIGRALVGNPALLLLDEPLEGLAPVIVQEIASRIPMLMREEGLAIMLVEQHATFALGLTKEAIVLERGRVSHAGSSAALTADPALIERLIGMRRLTAGEALAAVPP